MAYLGKMKGASSSPPRASLYEVFWSWLGSFLGIAAVALVHFRVLSGTDLLFVIGSFGASAVLIYGAIQSPLAQPRNLLGGHIISATIGVSCFQVLGGGALSAALAVSIAIAVMHLTKTLHPPGGATALIAVTGGKDVYSLGYLFVLVPTGTGALLMLLVALLVNNIPQKRYYPEFWI